MAEPAARLFLITPLLEDASAFAPRLAEACAAAPVAAVLARLAPADERTLVNRVKALAPAAQDQGAALVVAAEGADLATVAARGGADGVHADGPADLVRDLRERLKGERSVGSGAGKTRDDAMNLGEAGADYLLFGEPRPDGSLPPLEATIERAAWWAEIFETPCVIYAPGLGDVAACAATNAEFVALGGAVWDHPEGPASAVREAHSRLAALEGAP
jgi:thiamine-phosphate pyrophosphorylase